MSDPELANTTNHTFDTQRGSDLNPALDIKSHGALFFLISTLALFLQVKFQSTNHSPFDTHSGIMLTFIVTLLIYVISMMVKISLLGAQNSTYYKIISKVNLLIGVLAAILLLLILAPVVGWIIFAIWVPCFVIIPYDSCRKLCTWLYQATRPELNRLYEATCRVLGRGSTVEQNQLPV